MNEKLSAIIKKAGEDLIDTIEGDEEFNTKDLLHASLSLAVSMWHHATDMTDDQVTELFADPIDICLAILDDENIEEVEHTKPTLLH